MSYKIKFIKTLLIITFVPSLGLNTVLAEADKNYLNLSEKLVSLRGQVSDLSNELQLLRDEHKLEMRGLITQKNTVNSSLKQEKIAIDQLQENLLTNKKLIQEIGADKDTIKDALLIETENLKNYIKTGLPFKVKERLKSVDDYEKRLEAGVLSSHKAANTLWSMIEDELKLSRDNGVYRQSVVLGDKEHLAHVAKIGMVMMYLRVGDDEYGLYRKAGDNWVAEVSKDSRDIEQIKTLFTSLEKQVHVGYFEIPNAL